MPRDLTALPGPENGSGSGRPSRIGASLRCARERAGWTREALAFHSGLSWAAIAQIESGRRQEVRVSSLLALAHALGISVDYLVGGKATVSPQLLAHQALVYGSDEEYLRSAVPFLLEGIRRSNGLIAVTTPHQLDLLRNELGNEVARVEFQDASEWYRSPIGALNDYRTFVREQFGRGAPWIRIIGEPVWAGRSDAEVAQWMRYESMINLSLAPSPVTILCSYDARAVPDRVLAGARCTHPETVENGAPGTSGAYIDAEELFLGRSSFA